MPLCMPPPQDISNLRASLGDGMDQGLTSPPASGIYVPYVTSYYSVLIPTTPQALAFQRTPDEVLAIVYGNALGTPGGAQRRQEPPDMNQPGPGTACKRLVAHCFMVVCQVSSRTASTAASSSVHQCRLGSLCGRHGTRHTS